MYEALGVQVIKDDEELKNIRLDLAQLKSAHAVAAAAAIRSSVEETDNIRDSAVRSDKAHSLVL